MMIEGTFRARVIETGLGKSQQGKRQVGIVFEIKQRGPFDGQRLKWWGALNTKANAERAVKVMRACGYDGRSLASVGRSEVEIVVGPEEYNGRTYSRIRWVNELRSVTGGLEERETTELEEKLSALAHNLGLVDAPVAYPEPDADGVIDEDGIPF